MRRFKKAVAVAPPRPLTWARILNFAFRLDENGRWRASAEINDDLNPNGWASVEELEADLPRAVSEFYEAVVGSLVCLAHYHPRSRTMLVVLRDRPNTWQDRDKVYAETVRDLINDAFGDGVKKVDFDGK